MKKVAAILLSAALVFNWVGYRLVIYCMEHKAATKLEAQLDSDNYDESQLISIKVPALHLSYYTNSSQFERTNGQVEINGVQYKYVKKRFFNDSLEYVCIPDRSATQLQMAQNDFFKQVNDLQHVRDGKKPSTHSSPSVSFSPDYFITHLSFKLHNPGFAGSKGSSFYLTVIPTSFLLTAEEPPETIA